jgi:GNAT superfamily N-acetyltransferase
MNILPLNQNDLTYIPALLPPGWDSAMPAIQFYLTSDFCFPFKAMVHNNLAGTGTAIIHNDVAWLAHIIVHPDYRNQGIGQLITRYLVDFVHAKECDTIYLLATELGEPVYRKIGFETETEYLFFKADKPIASFLQDERIVPYSNDFEKQVAQLDHQVSGEDRFFHISHHLSDGFVYAAGSSVQGFYLPTMGDGLIIATTSIAGQALMKLRLTTKDFAVFPVDNGIATTFIQQYPFKVIRRQKRMRLGKKRNWQPKNIYNRIGGNMG